MGAAHAGRISQGVRRTAVGAVLALALALPTHAAAVERSAEEVRALAARAAQDPVALEELRRTDVVNGRAADVAAALDGAREGQLAARLRALARPASAPSPVAAAATRDDARAILAEGRFATEDQPRARRTLGQRVRDWIADRFDALDEIVPGPAGIALALLGLLVLVVAAVLTSRVTGRLQLASEARPSGLRGRTADPSALERDAAGAEAAGNYAAGVRLRFAAGLVRLDAAQAIRLRPSLTTGQVGRALGSDRFDALAATFDEVAYGGRPAQPADAEAAREAWPRVLREAGR
jgi:hypothetical protein